MSSYYAHGKLLISGEYAVLKGALALAIPVRFGQHLTYSANDSSQLHWESMDRNDEPWLEVRFDQNLEVISTNDEPKAEFLRKLLKKGFELSGEAFRAGKVQTRLEFDRDWGLGSSSSLTYLVADWLGADQMKLHFSTQNGSGYDVACASAKSPLLYQRNSDIYIHHLKLPEAYSEAYFVHLGHKQQSAPEVTRFMDREVSTSQIEQISAISLALTMVNDVDELSELLAEHEALMSALLQRPTVQESLFSDFDGIVKSLGAWGGDFVMALGSSPEDYFTAKGFKTCLSFNEMIFK